MIFVGSKVFVTHARYWQIKKYTCMHDFFLWGAGGHRESVGGGGGHVPPPPRSYAPGLEA